jgi:hypothetical protein
MIGSTRAFAGLYFATDSLSENLTFARRLSYSSYRGTDGSNPLSSNGESGANLIFDLT